MKILIVTGGTGGHIYPALALADAIQRKYKNADILFVGNHDRMEAVEIPKKGYQFIGLQAKGLTGGISGKMKAVMMMMKAYRKAIDIIKEFKPDIAIGFGGYVSAPVILAAHHEHVTTMIHEQNSIVGVANKVCARYADAIVICYEKCLEVFDKNKTRLLGNPRASEVKNIPFDKDYFNSLGLIENKPLILVVMGSLGSTSVNEIMVDALKDVSEDYQILYVTGKNNYETMKNRFNKKNIKVVDYVKQLEIIEKVDLMICRAGATTAAEITAKGTPSIIIPSPYVANNHQFYNANVLVENKCAFMLEEKDITSEKLKDKIDTIMENESLRKQMKENALKLGFPNASEDIISWIEEMKR